MKKEEWASLDRAVDILNELHDVKPEEYGRNAYSKKTIYNAISKKQVRRKGPRHAAVVLVSDLILRFGPKKSA